MSSSEILCNKPIHEEESKHGSDDSSMCSMCCACQKEL
jgi:hypothetical protein